MAARGPRCAWCGWRPATHRIWWRAPTGRTTRDACEQDYTPAMTEAARHPEHGSALIDQITDQPADTLF